MKKEIISIINQMCEESLSPDLFEKWEEVKKSLYANRKSLLNSVFKNNYDQQFQSPTEVLTTEIMVLRERIEELESCLSKHLTYHNAEMEALQMPTSKDWYELYSETEVLINKSK